MPHAAFLRRADPDPATIEARCGQAAFQVLRPVDLFAAGLGPGISADAFQHEWIATDRFVQEVEHGRIGEAGYLLGIMDSAIRLAAQVG